MYLCRWDPQLAKMWMIHDFMLLLSEHFFSRYYYYYFPFKFRIPRLERVHGDPVPMM